MSSSRLIPPESRPAIIAAFMERDLDAVTSLVADTLGRRTYRFQLNGALSPGPAGVSWQKLKGENSILSFNPDACKNVASGLIIDRLLEYMTLTDIFSARTSMEGHCILNVGDEGHFPGLAYCGNRPEHILVPDCIYLSFEGYIHQANHYAKNPISWKDRQPIVFWRGSTTGYRAGDVFELPRVHLCLKAKEFGSRADIGLASLVQLKEEQEREQLINLGIVRDYVPATELNKYKYHIDIDGNSNSWPGLLMKLHSGSPVLKIRSPSNFRQWYYDRMVPWKNYVPIETDMSDLEEKIAFLFDNDEEAERIGRAGQELAASMTLQAELKLLEPSVNRAMACN